jgi:hypothetical protein
MARTPSGRRLLVAANWKMNVTPTQAARYVAELLDLLTEIEKELTWRMRAGAELRKFKLANADEPDFTFEA